jgi:hypothetical protein
LPAKQHQVFCRRASDPALGQILNEVVVMWRIAILLVNEAITVILNLWH